MTRRALPYAALAAVCAVPRLVALLYERSDVTSAFVDKGDDFAQTFVASGTYGFVPGHPSAYTQPLYGFFLVPLYWILERSWLIVGLAQIAVAVATAILVYLAGKRIVSERAALLAAALATLNPYLVWHDVHMNREILDQLLAAAIVLAVLAVSQRTTLQLAAALGVLVGIAILGNVRLAALPLLLGAFLLWDRGLSRRALAAAGAVVAAAALVVMPWVVRNKVNVGCWAVTTDAKALWKANNANTYETLASGRWIDDVPQPSSFPPTPEDAYVRWRETGELQPTDECAQMTMFQRLVREFWREHPGEKGRLAVQAARMEWQPSAIRTEGRPGEGTWLDTARTWAQPLYSIPLLVLAAIGLAFVPRRFAVLAVSLLAYQTVVAMIFVGATRYRVPWDFVLALLAAPAALALLAGARRGNMRAPVVE